MMKSNQKSEKSIKSVIQKTDIWKNFIKFNSIFVICLALTLAGVKIPAKADDYYLRWYTSNENPLNITRDRIRVVNSSVDSAYETTVGEYGYFDYLVNVQIRLFGTGFTTGYTYYYRPSLVCTIKVPNSLPTGFSLDAIFLDSYDWRGQLSDIQIVEKNWSSTPRDTYILGILPTWEFKTMTASTTEIMIELAFKVRIYCSDANAVSLYSSGQYNLALTCSFGSTDFGEFAQAGAYIANFSPLEIDFAQYQQFLIANNYLDSIATAITPSSPPDPAVNEAETKASEAEDLQEEEESLYEDFASVYDEDALDDVFEDEIEPMFQDAGIAAGLVFWKDWVNHHFNKGYNDGEHFSSTLSIVFNIMARLWK